MAKMARDSSLMLHITSKDGWRWVVIISENSPQP